MLLLVVVVVVVVSRTCDGKYFHDQLAARRDQAGRPGQAQSGWRNYLAVGKYWCKLAGWLAATQHHGTPPPPAPGGPGGARETFISHLPPP